MPPRKRTPGDGSGTRIDATRHVGATRANIPTAELEGFVRDEDEAPRIVHYPRDPSLDPQLVWRGKDEQDSHDLEVAAVPIYIQEKISPLALVDDLRRQHAGNAPAQAELFADFNGITFENAIEFYKHQQNWSNRMILGDSLQVMTSLAEKEGLRGQVQCIYIDPPYGIKFGSNWQVSTRKRDVRDGKVVDATRQPEQVKAFRDTWELAVHSYLLYMRDRLAAARALLAPSGSVFVQIGDENVHLVRCLMDEVFGSENFVSQIAVLKTTSATAEHLAGVADYVLFYAMDASQLKFRNLWVEARDLRSGYRWVRLADGTRRAALDAELANECLLPSGAALYMADNITSQRPPGSYPVSFEGRTFTPARSFWKTSASGMNRLILAGRLHAAANSIRYIRLKDDFPFRGLHNVWTDMGTGNFTEEKVYVVQSAAKLVERCILMTTDPGDLVLDPTCGSGTTAYVAEQWGRRWITVDTSRVALALARTRLMTAKFPYYTLADSPAGVRLQAERAGQLPPSPPPPTTGDIRRGFVYKQVPHVTLKSIANNPDIHEGMSREAIDAAISRHAESETLYDQPHEDRRVVRVTGPFTVESLSPHHALPSDDQLPRSEQPGAEDDTTFVAAILDNLRVAGVQNGLRAERLNFDTLDPWPGRQIHAAGDYTESDKPRRVAVCIGPRYGTVDAGLVRDAALEATRMRADLLIVCGFAFDAHASEEAREMGRLTILRVNMNPDLNLGAEVLKKTRAANLFTVFGEPDIAIGRTDGDQVLVTIRGVDIYNPVTGEASGHGTGEIACWFIDTDYNGESFFVRHAYFLGDREPYDQLKRALRADIDEAAWETLYRAESRPFTKPTTGRIAIKVINHYGDEVMKVYPVT